MAISDKAYGAAFSPDGSRLATSGADGLSLIHMVSVEELLKVAQERVTRSLTADE